MKILRYKRVCIFLASILLLTSVLFFALLELGLRLVTWSPQREIPYKLRTIDKESKTYSQWMGLVHDPLTDLGLSYEKIEMPSADGVPLKGWFIPAKNNKRDCAISLVHGRGSDRRCFLKHLAYLPQTQCALLMFDIRNHGESGSFSLGSSLGYFESRDVIASVDFLKTVKGFKKVHVFGTSLGAAATLIAAAQYPSIDSVIAENGFASVPKIFSDFNGPSVQFVKNIFPRGENFLLFLEKYIAMRMHIDKFLNPADLISKISPRPVLIIHSKEDSETPYDHAHVLYHNAREPKELFLSENGNHSAVYNQNKNLYEKTVLTFLGAAPPL